MNNINPNSNIFII